MKELNTHQPILKNTLEIEKDYKIKDEDLEWLKNKFKINCSRFALNVFAQLSLLVPALFLVVYKPSKRKRAIGDVLEANRAVRNHPEKVLCRASSLMKGLSSLMTNGRQRNFEIVRCHEQRSRDDTGDETLLPLFGIGRHHS